MGVTDSNGNVATLYTMEAFGNVLQITNGGDFSNTTSSDYQPYHLTTKEFDPDSGLYYFFARWYDASTGRWISGDPAKGALSRIYAFCGDDPVNLLDPDGARVTRRWTWPWTCARQIFKTVWTAYPDQPRNALRHCVASCLVARRCIGGCAAADFGGWWYEYHTGFGDDWEIDLQNNKKGLYCAGCGISHWGDVVLHFWNEDDPPIAYEPPGWSKKGGPSEDCTCCCEKVTGENRHQPTDPIGGQKQ